MRRSKGRALRRRYGRGLAHHPPPRPLPVGRSKRWVLGFEHFSGTEAGHPFDAWLEHDDRGVATLSVRVNTGSGFRRVGKTYRGGAVGAERAARAEVRSLLRKD